MVEEDGIRLKEVRRWIQRCAADPSRLATASPACGAWLLRFDVVLAEPALQKVVVERRAEDGSWRLLRGRMTIEFRAEAARPRTTIRREFCVPLGGPGDTLRIAVRGIGRVGVSNVELTDGVCVLRPHGRAATRLKVIGLRAPRDGFPVPDWDRNSGPAALVFTGR
jgi:hypothetical protein